MARRLTIMDYKILADKAGLDRHNTKRYIQFMRRRFPEERDKGYAYEWAERFKRGVEYNASDYESRQILEEIDTIFSLGKRKLSKRKNQKT
jgi:hypothetical protein